MGYRPFQSIASLYHSISGIIETSIMTGLFPFMFQWYEKIFDEFAIDTRINLVSLKTVFNGCQYISWYEFNLCTRC